MLICIPGILDTARAAAMRARLDAADWIDGRGTAGAQSGRVKRNAQIAEGSALAIELGDQVLDALAANPLFVSAAVPLRTFPPLFNRYAEGEAFGTHVDNAIRMVRGTSVRIRTDVSGTLFLSEPKDYDGGELVIETAFGAQEVKLPAGHLVLYPATSLHHVRPVTRGARIASFFWLQSMVRDECERALLFDLDQTIQALAVAQGLDHPEIVRLTGIYHNLFRRWAEV